MKIAEIRIGNLFQDEDGNTGFITDSFFLLLEINLVLCKPVKLTEEHLVAFGFEDMKDPCVSVYCIGYNKDEDGEDTEAFCLTKDINDVYYAVIGHKKIEFQYVHKLQNFYFEWTNEELTQNQQK
jgi:hypothetical protein